MKLTSINASLLSIPFKVAFKHASAERSVTQTIWVEIRSDKGQIGFGEACPRDYVTGETVESALAFIRNHQTEWIEAITNIVTLTDWVKHHSDIIDANPAAWSAVEVALLDLLAKTENKSVEVLLCLPKLTGKFCYTGVLGDAAPDQFKKQLDGYVKAGFQTFKIKLSGQHQNDLAKVAILNSAGILPRHVRADANNLWSEAKTAIHDLAALNFPFVAIEEPLQAGDYDGMRQIANSLNTSIILDESLLRSNQLNNLTEPMQRWIINVRISKMGGLLRSLKLVEEARQRRLRVVVGAHVGETSLLTRAALTAAHCARDILFAQEGAFGTHLLTHDVVEKPLMFGAAGILDSAAFGLANAPGFGLTVAN